MKEVKSRWTSGSPADVTVNEVASPQKAASTYAAALLTLACPEGYSWNAGVRSSGVQAGSEVA